jgi:peptide deformylase
MRKIVIYPNEILRQKTKEVEVVDKKLIRDIDDLRKILTEGANAAGLAAVQIGVEKRFFGSKEFEGNKVEIFINPRVEKTYGGKIYPKIVDENKRESDFLEGCLSFPKYFGTVKRYLSIDVSWDEIKGEKLVREFRKLNGFEAIVWQHESDHLDGIVFVDHIKKDGGKFFKEMNGGMEETKMVF